MYPGYTVVESALFSRLIRNGVSIGQHVDLGMPWRDAFFRNQLHQRPGASHLSLYKLHGSLNWLRCELCGYMTMNVRQRIASLDSRDTHSPRGYNVCNCGGLLRSLLVTPSVARDVRDASLLGIWKAALEDLRNAHEWILVGYSLPLEDIAIRSLLLRAWHARRIKRLRVTVVQHESEAGGPSATYQRYRVFFPSESLPESRYRRSGVQGFVESLAPFSDATLDKGLRRHICGRTRSEMSRRENEHAEIARERQEANRARKRNGGDRGESVRRGTFDAARPASTEGGGAAA